jgi:hypothetical protein
MANKGLPASGANRSADSLTRTYNSFGGIDIQATFGGKLIGELQGISYTVQREKAPIYTMGEADPRSFSRGKRGIAGSLVFNVFDRSALLEVMRDRPYIANKYSIPEGFQIADINDANIFEAQPGIVSPAVGTASPTVSRIALDKVLARPQYLDQVLPFDIVITASNEYGAVAQMAIHGVEIINSGSSLSMDDITTDEACTFIATSLTSWHKQGFIKIRDDGRSTEFVGR